MFGHSSWQVCSDSSWGLVSEHATDPWRGWGQNVDCATTANSPLPAKLNQVLLQYVPVSPSILRLSSVPANRRYPHGCILPYWPHLAVGMGSSGSWTVLLLHDAKLWLKSPVLVSPAHCTFPHVSSVSPPSWGSEFWGMPCPRQWLGVWWSFTSVFPHNSKYQYRNVKCITTLFC